MKLDIDIKGPFFPSDKEPGQQAEVLRMVEAMLRVSYFRDRMGGPEMTDFIEAIRTKANELDAEHERTRTR